MHLQAGVASDRGLVRSVNEDSFFLREGLYAVCDGMGGARGGEVASQMACLGLLSVNPASAGQQDLREAVAGANRNIAQRSATDHHLMGMGTTLTAALIHEGNLTLAHVGDSRAYLLHRGDLTQLTEDHSWVGEMVRRGDLTPAQAAIHPHRSVITRALGTEDKIETDLSDIPISAGDRILICSDGLTGMVPDTDLLELLEQGQGAQATAELLVKAALASGGEDNVTVVVIDVLAGDAEPNEEKKESGPFSGQILFGPSDRGAMVAASVHRAGRAVGGVRDRLSRKTPPVVRPVAGRGDRAATDDSSSYTDAPVAGPPFAGAPLAVPLAEITAEEPGPDSAPHSAQPAGTQPDEAPVTMATGSENLVETPATADEARQPVPMPKAKAGASRLLRGKRGKWFFLALAVVLILVIIVAAFAIYNSSVYYVGTYADGTVALYRGLPHSVLGIELSYAIQLGTVKYDALAPPQQQQVDAHDLVSKEEGQALLQSLVP